IRSLSFNYQNHYKFNGVVKITTPPFYNLFYCLSLLIYPSFSFDSSSSTSSLFSSSLYSSASSILFSSSSNSNSSSLSVFSSSVPSSLSPSSLSSSLPSIFSNSSDISSERSSIYSCNGFLYSSGSASSNFFCASIGSSSTSSLVTKSKNCGFSITISCFKSNSLS